MIALAIAGKADSAPVATRPGYQRQAVSVKPCARLEFYFKANLQIFNCLTHTERLQVMALQK